MAEALDIDTGCPDLAQAESTRRITITGRGRGSARTVLARRTSRFRSLGSGYPALCVQLQEEAMEGEREQLSFERDVRPLFRERDRGAMLGVAKFDLWARDDVAEHSQAILERLESGSMPCDQAWPDEQVALFRRWLDAGMPA
jgi:hypothetical protein